MEEYATSHHSINGNGMNLFHLPGNSKKGGNAMNKSTSSTTSSLSSSCNSIQNVTSLISPESSPLLTSKYQSNGTISKSSSSINNNNNNINNNGKIRKELPLIMDDSINNNSNNSNGEVFSSTFDQLSNHISQNKIFSDLNKFISNVHCATTSLATGNRSSPPSPPSNTSTPPTNSKLVQPHEITSSTSSTNLLLSVSGSFLPKKNSRDYNNNNDEMTIPDDLSPSSSSTSSVGGNSRSYSRNSSSNNLHVLQQQQIQHQLQQQQQSQQQYEQYNNDNNSEWQLNEPVLKKKRKSLDLEPNYKTLNNNNNNNSQNNTNNNNHVSYPNSPIIDNNDLQGVVQSQRKTIFEQNEYIKQMEQKLEFYKNEYNGFKRKMASSIYDLLLIYEKNNNNLDDNCLPDKIKFPTTSQLKLNNNNNNNNSNNNILEYENNNLDSSISGLVKLNKSNEIQKPQQQIQQPLQQPPPKKQVHILPKHGSNGNLKSYNDQPPPQLVKTNSLKQLQSQQTQYIFENISEQQAKLIKRN